MPRVKYALLIAKNNISRRVSTWMVKTRGEEERPAVGASVLDLCLGKEMKLVLKVVL